MPAKAQINRRKNYLYSHEDRGQIISVMIHTSGELWRGRIPLITKDTLKGVGVGIYRPTKKIYNDPKQFPGKEMPQREFRLAHYSYQPI